ncbi:unnamed protein product [Microthlaspi erraticum]|uniref:F-box domain-containing protein n=1 Tax=Microthlaspi erraticum TaxID=1685480 RepID=A0A6D2LDI2_9BRAS|nr:unnamed protein product [Microthlaspi erraticum]
MVMEASSDPNKRLCRLPVPSLSSSSSGQHLDPILADVDQKHVDQIISSFLSLSVSPSFSSSEAIGSSFERALEKMFIYSVDESVNLDRGLELSSLLHESTKRWYRRQATTHNSIAWPLPSELTVKVFSMVDTKSLVQASACCTMFKKCALDQVCYSNVDLTTANVKSQVVRNMILKAGKELRSLKVGCRDESTDNPMLIGSCLAPLSYQKHGVLGY